MALKIIGPGFGRTGTSSLSVALTQLGFPCYHMLEVLENSQNKDHLDFWCRVANSPPGIQHPWEQVFANYTATVDNPGCCVWRELMVAYPDAKILLTVHPGGAEAWYDSTIATIYFIELLWQFTVLESVIPFFRKMGDMGRKLIWQRSHQGTMKNREAAIALYHRHIEDVKAAVPPEKLLVYSVAQGWKPLCDFLGVPVPDAEFPNVNDRADFQKRLVLVRVTAYAIIGIGVLAVGALIYGGVRLLS